MYMKKSVVYLFVSVFFLFTSCEYRLGENFVEMERHPADSVLMDVYLNLSEEYEGGYYVDKTCLASFTVYPFPGYKVEKCVIRLGKMEWESDDSRGDFFIDVDRIPNGTYELTCEVQASTNNGTVAGQVGAGHYVETRGWPVKVKARNESDHLLECRMTEEGYPEIFWEVDESLRAGFDHYTIEHNYDHMTYIRRSLDFDQRSFVDKTYDGVGGTYTVYIYFKDETIRPYSLGKVVLEVPDTFNPENNPEK